MDSNIYNERMLNEEEREATISGNIHTARDPIKDSMFIIFVMDDGHEIRIVNKDDHIEVSTSTGVLNVRPEASNAIKIGSARLGSAPRGTSYASL